MPHQCGVKLWYTLCLFLYIHQYYYIFTSPENRLEGSHLAPQSTPREHSRNSLITPYSHTTQVIFKMQKLSEFLLSSCLSEHPQTSPTYSVLLREAIPLRLFHGIKELTTADLGTMKLRETLIPQLHVVATVQPLFRTRLGQLKVSQLVRCQG